MSGLLGLNLQHADLPTFFSFSLQETISIRKLVKFESLAHFGFFFKRPLCVHIQKNGNNAPA